MHTHDKDLWLPLPPPFERSCEAALPLPSSSIHAWERFWSHPLGKSGLALLLPILLFICIGPFLSGYSYDALHLAYKNQPPSSQFWFGTDDLGRDIFTRIWYGAAFP